MLTYNKNVIYFMNLSTQRVFQLRISIEKVIISDVSSIFSTIIVETCTTTTMLIQRMCKDFY